MTMTSTEPLPAAVLTRKAVIYIRQSTQAQVQSNLESQRRQYELVDVARQRGFREIEVIDEDLGRSASGLVARPGFERLVAGLCSGEVGAVLCFDASRLARNGRDWHHRLELCGLVQARVELQQARYEASLAERRYAACDPDNRLIAAQLEKNWETALRRVAACEARLREMPSRTRPLSRRTSPGWRMISKPHGTRPG
jgi:Resolvase, N terminal domain